MQKLAEWTRARWLELRKDVWDDPSIGPVAGLLLSVLAGLIVWLTLEYAPGAVDRAEQAASETKQAGQGVIAPFWGSVTIALMTVATLTTGFEPIVGRRLERWWRRTGKRGWFRLARPVRWMIFAPVAFVLVPAKLASFVWSLADYVLARPVAILAGAAWRGWVRRYVHFAALMLLAVGASLAADEGRLAPEVALAAIVAGLLGVLAIVRRWGWIEGDRDTFLIERGEREEGKGTLRIGFKEDLRDEALSALACLFFLIPLGLDLVQQTTMTSGAPAFAFSGDALMPEQFSPRFFTWLGYFGAELAKTVPFVDWSEVFHVANGSPIEAQTPFGSQLAFVLRAGLDLLFLAAVLQAVQIAGRLRDQRRAFDNNRLPILEPFTERLELARAFEQFNEDLDLRPSAQPAILDFPRYDAVRLKELIAGEAETKDPKVRKAAAALLQKDYEAAPDSNPDTPKFFSERSNKEPDNAYRGWLLHVASGAEPDDPARLGDAERRKRLLKLIGEDWNDPRARAQAVRLLGRRNLSAPEQDELLGRLNAGEAIEVQAAAAVALAKTDNKDAFSKINKLIQLTPEPAILPAQALAYALAHDGTSAEEISAKFATTLDPHALVAARIQRAPMDFKAGKTADKFTALCETVAVTPGQGFFPDHFLMGSKPEDAQAFENEKPQRKVAMTRAFALGRFAVTQAEYKAFTDATGRPALQHFAQASWPATYVSWFDALAYCRWLEMVTGQAWRLPSEAEWEYACRAGTDSAYSWGQDWDEARAMSNQSGQAPLNVGSYQPNEWGLWDMHGNVAEWCLDPWHDDYRSDPPADQTPWREGGDFSHRVLRGGSWINYPRDLRSANRYWNQPAIRYDLIGFRVARTL